MPYVDAGDIPAAKVPRPFERELKVVMSPQTHKDVEGFTLLFSTLAPKGGGTDSHAHEDSGELMVVVSGRGKAWLAGEEFSLKPGAALYAPPGVEHRTLNEGGIPLELVCVFVPPASADYVEKMIARASEGADG
jgi:mannose-6-phosphate isomerase-like protein (cupin superfamily)